MKISTTSAAKRPAPATEALLSAAGTELFIGKGREEVIYDLFEFPTAWPGRSFRLDKQHGATSYSVFISEKPSDDYPHRCECRGFERFGWCKHVDSLAGLIADGSLPDPRAFDPATLPVAPVREDDPFA